MDRPTGSGADSASTPLAIAEAFAGALAAAQRFDAPFPHFFAEDLLPAAVLTELASLPIIAPPATGPSGRREYHNAARCFCNGEAISAFRVLRALAEALQSQSVVASVAALCSASLAGTFLRIEYAIDRAGFWLEPHTDLGVKKFTCLISLAQSEDQSSLGTDIYTPDKRLYRRFPFRGNAGLIFVPSDRSWHGFAPRSIRGERRSLIINYVGPEWRARDQLAFPDTPIHTVGNCQV